MRTTILALTVMLAGAAVGCSPASGGTASTPCRTLDGSCSVSSDCCSPNACSRVSFTCVEPSSLPVCHPIGFEGCTAQSDCCEGPCENGTCVAPQGSCALVGQPCTANGGCCNGNCPAPTGGGARVCALAAPPTCGGEGAACTLDSQCCSTQCSEAGFCTTTSFCKTSGTACSSDSQCCSLNCPGAPTPGATCSSAACRPSGTGLESSCGTGSDCCSGICSGGKCQAIPPASGSGGSCTTLGEACDPLTTACCSTNCQDGTCLPASYCNATGDVCWRAEDCCSGLCTVSAGSTTPGRCEAPSGSGCTQDGVPCTNDSNCCTRKCLDLGTGAKVCQPAGGCRMTGNYCDSTGACCGGTDSDDTTARSPYGVYCDQQGQRDYTPYWDPSNKDNRVCTSGQSCNPPGNICGGSGGDKANASQNCCNDFGSGKDVCKPDLNGIMRCFGSPSDSCTTGSGGYDGGVPGCCIPEGDVCQFRDQCCDYAPCVPDGAGVLRCSVAASQCLPRGAECSTDGPPTPADFGTVHPGANPCCTGDSCKYIGIEIGWACAADVCSNVGDGCTQSGQCCVGSCVGGTCRTCQTTAETCTSAAECCSGICTSGKCGATCIPEEGVCTATSDCCPVVGTSVSCVYQPGSTNGVCTTSSTPPAPTCANTGDACSASMPCCSGVGNVCLTEGVAAGTCGPPPPPSCKTASQGCTGTGAGDCCDDLWCRNIMDCPGPECPDPYNPPPPTACSGTYCACEGCSVIGEPCSSTLPCCLSSQSYCGVLATGDPCPAGQTCECIDTNM